MSAKFNYETGNLEVDGELRLDLTDFPGRVCPVCDFFRDRRNIANVYRMKDGSLALVCGEQDCDSMFPISQADAPVADDMFSARIRFLERQSVVA